MIVIRFGRIREDEDLGWLVDEYFDYSHDLADRMPPELRAFAVRSEHYQLQGKYSLHDSRMRSFAIRKEPTEEEGISNATSVDVIFLDQLFEHKFSLHYGGVSSFVVSEGDLPTRRATDVLMHEVSVLSKCNFRQVVRFDGGGCYAVEFSSFNRQLNLVVGGRRREGGMFIRCFGMFVGLASAAYVGAVASGKTERVH